MSFGAAFLRCPDLFPARRGGEPWGRGRAVLALPGGPYQVSGLSPAQEELVRARFGPYCRPSGEPAGPAEPAESAVVAARLFAVAPSDFLAVETRGWEYRLDLDHAPACVRLAGLRLLGRLDWTPHLTGALWTPEEGALFPGVFENFLRALVAYRLAETGGALLHCAAVAESGGAFLFLGRSGAGKTTLARLSLAQGRTVLSDDLNAVRPVPGGALVEPLPFTGDLPPPAPGEGLPLRALLRLEKGGDDVRSESPARMVAALVACSPFLNADPFRRGTLTATLEGLARAAPGGTLTFSPAGTFWAMLLSGFP